MFQEFRRHLPSMSLHLGYCGAQQGDPLGPLGFALTLHPIVNRIRSSLTLNAWYLDDGTL